MATVGLFGREKKNASRPLLYSVAGSQRHYCMWTFFPLHLVSVRSFSSPSRPGSVHDLLLCPVWSHGAVASASWSLPCLHWCFALVRHGPRPFFAQTDTNHHHLMGTCLQASKAQPVRSKCHTRYRTTCVRNVTRLIQNLQYGAISQGPTDCAVQRDSFIPFGGSGHINIRPGLNPRS